MYLILIKTNLKLSGSDYNGGYEGSLWSIKVGIKTYFKRERSNQIKILQVMNICNSLLDIIKIGENSIDLMKKGFSTYVYYNLLIIAAVLNNYNVFNQKFSEIKFMQKCFNIFNYIMVQTYEKVSEEWSNAYHFDNEREEFINDDIIFDIVSIFDTIQIEAKKEIFSYCLAVTGSVDIVQKTVALSYLSESINEFDDEKKIIAVPLTKKLIEIIKETNNPRILFTLIHNLALVLETREDH